MVPAKKNLSWAHVHVPREAWPRSRGVDPVGSAEEAEGGSGVLPDPEPQFLTERVLTCPAKEELRPS